MAFVITKQLGTNAKKPAICNKPGEANVQFQIPKNEESHDECGNVQVLAWAY